MSWHTSTSTSIMPPSPVSSMPWNLVLICVFAMLAAMIGAKAQSPNHGAGHVETSWASPLTTITAPPPSPLPTGGDDFMPLPNPVLGRPS